MDHLLGISVMRQLNRRRQLADSTGFLSFLMSGNWIQVLFHPYAVCFHSFTIVIIIIFILFILFVYQIPVHICSPSCSDIINVRIWFHRWRIQMLEQNKNWICASGLNWTSNPLFVRCVNHRIIAPSEQEVTKYSVTPSQWMLTLFCMLYVCIS